MAKKQDLEKKIKALEKLGCSQSEIQAVLKSDEEIDKGNTSLFKLSLEQEKVSKKYRGVGTKKTATAKTPPTPIENKQPKTYQLDNTGGKHSKKKDEIKSTLIAELANSLTANGATAVQNIQIINPERQIDFEIDGISYSFTLIKHNKKK